MAYIYLDDRATADVAFRATGRSLEEVFSSAVDAVLNTMVQNVESIRPRLQRPADLKAESVEMLLFGLLQEVIFAKDAEGVLLRALVRRLTAAADGASCEAVLRGEPIDRSRHEILVDVKGVTLHGFRVAREADGWSAEVVLDV